MQKTSISQDVRTQNISSQRRSTTIKQLSKVISPTLIDRQQTKTKLVKAKLYLSQVTWRPAPPVLQFREIQVREHDRRDY
ncbi:hypothetical protein T4D_4009 [Trichinella pseudospiralis]|uniref:Uncharacterized protein n=1 Tax=Trichinella pseudospiralis TaxID=6337 RepID=A0A0V1F5E6_TRIPS|nr:hypothetical protein T4D_4009 [Trichinella pseudospiralis]